MSVRPFSPSESFAFPKPPSSARPKSSENPFDDPKAGATSSTDILPGSLETVIRPFAPTLHDELSVDPGDLVTVVTAFDDGWAQVKKKIDGTTGLIPIDCFRSMGEDVPAFLASKRVSSYFETRRQ
ncbi:hypothetical protein FA95DRAFT_1500146 [Auriscalpium vulgare]|uniref:Uncharacterized protein n=1 Tax=Auriscalpium vulgare TaxID=40419 RepID=A0ACB8RES3_9AGAM|nr:hypothetical protein FA95DRAFT_1500146 [Auriscalpium vulgare]